MNARFATVPPIGTSPDLLEDILRWVASEPLQALVSEFGAGTELITDPAELTNTLAWLDQFTDRWDTRKGQERHLAAELELTTSQSAFVLDAAEALGLRTAHPPRHRSYDYVMVLGGLVRACVARPSYAAYLINSRQITADCVVALGGHRPFSGNEFEYAKTLGISEVSEEYEALDAATRRAFMLDKPEFAEGESSTLVGGTWGIRRYRDLNNMHVVVAAAPSSKPNERRANTADTYAWFAEYLAHLKPQQRLLMISTSIYVPAQHAAAVQMLQVPYGVEVETIGMDAAVTGSSSQTSTPTKYLQEVRSAVRAVRNLHATITRAHVR